MKFKTLLAFFSILSLTITTKAQITKGDTWLGGYLGFYGGNSGYSGSFSQQVGMNFTPAVGRVVRDNLVAGVELIYTYSRSENSYNNERRSIYNYGAGLFIRKYVPVLNRLYIYGHAASEGLVITDKGSNAGTGKGWSANINVHPGVSFTVNRKLQIESGFTNLFYASYSKVRFKDSYNPSEKYEQYSAGLSLENPGQFYIGFRLLLPGKS